jgi:hypothetical protein
MENRMVETIDARQEKRRKHEHGDFKHNARQEERGK